MYFGTHLNGPVDTILLPQRITAIYCCLEETLNNSPLANVRCWFQQYYAPTHNTLIYRSKNFIYPSFAGHHFPQFVPWWSWKNYVYRHVFEPDHRLWRLLLEEVENSTPDMLRTSINSTVRKCLENNGCFLTFFIIYIDIYLY